ncbi:MAG: copper resistance protein CopC [Austwickia sp.]|nr:copper resistance protein CopC [Austwickia sp.]
MAYLEPANPSTRSRSHRAVGSSPTWLVRAVLALVSVLALGVGLSSTAQGHAQLLRSTPADGSVVESAPTSVVLEFNEDINPAFAQVIVRNHAGATVPTDAPRVEGPKVITALPALSPGSVVVLYRVTSKDAHPISGKVTFTIDGAPGFAAPAPSGSDSTPGAGSSDQQAASGLPGESSMAGPAGPPAPWLYMVTGVAAAALMTLGAIVLRRERLAQRRPVGVPVPSVSPEPGT